MALQLAKSAVPSRLTGSIPLAAPDLACLLADSPSRPLNFAFVLNLGQSSQAVTDFGPLYRGAEGAREAFPVAASRLREPPFGIPSWETRPGTPPALAIRVFPEGERTLRIQEFLEAPFSLHEGPPLRQMLLGIGDPPSWSLVTQVHQAAADLIGALLFVQRQLRIARGLETMAPRPQLVSPQLLETPRRARRDSGARTAAALATQPGLPSASRQWRTIFVPREPLASLSQTIGGFRWNDCLLAAALDALAAWNEAQGVSAERIGLWVPMNTRIERLRDFGNGVSRIRVHRDPVDAAENRAFLERCRSVRRIVYRKKRTGEWALPEVPLPAALFPAAAPWLRRWLYRPWADFGTAGFTHLEQWPGEEDPVLNEIAGMEVIACLHERHPLYFAAMSRGEQAAVTITWDPALLREKDIDFIAAAFAAPLLDPPFLRSGQPWAWAD